MKRYCLIFTILALVLFQNKTLHAQALTANAGKDTAICEGLSVTIGGIPAASGGTAPYKYKWSPSTGLNYDTLANPIATPATTTTYILTVTDATLNTAIDTIIVTVKIIPTDIYTPPSSPICYGDCASLSCFPQGGYTCDWGNLGTGSIIVCPLVTTTYTSTITFTNGCTSTMSITVEVDPQLVVSVTSNPEHCYHHDGSLTASASGGTSPYTYLWSNNSTSPTITNLSAGTYSLTVVDAMACINTSTVVLMEIYGPTVTVSTTPEHCGACNGSATVDIFGGTPPYYFIWNNGITTQTATNLCAGTYYVSVYDSNGCEVHESGYVVNEAGPTVTVSTTPDYCGHCNGTATAYLSGGTPPYTYLWSTTPEQTTSTATNLCAGTYCVTVTDVNGCSATACGTVDNLPGLTVNITGHNATCGLCNGNATLSIISGGNPPYSYNWSNGETTPLIDSLCPGIYSVTLTDSYACTSTDTIVIENDTSKCYTIKGRVFVDGNQDCIQDASEDELSGKTLYVMPGHYTVTTNSLGDFSIMTDQINDTLYAPNDVSPNSFITCPLSGKYIINFSNYGDISYSNNFGFYITDYGIHENTEDNIHINIFPNPFHNEFTIEIHEGNNFPCEIIIYNNLSEIIKNVSLENSQNSITTSDWKEGIYFYFIKNNSGKIIGKGKMVLQ